MYYVYILTNADRTVLYVGMTRNLAGRQEQHFLQEGRPISFTGKYKVHNLIYWEEFTDVNLAKSRERQLKGWTREKKEWLIATKNPKWEFLLAPWTI